MNRMCLFTFSICFITFSAHTMKRKTKLQQLKRQKSRQIRTNIMESLLHAKNLSDVDFNKVLTLEPTKRKKFLNYLIRKAEEEEKPKLLRRTSSKKLIKQSDALIHASQKYIQGKTKLATIKAMLGSEKKSIDPFTPSEFYPFGAYQAIDEYGENIFYLELDDTEELDRVRKTLIEFAKKYPKKANAYLKEYNETTQKQEELNESRKKYRQLMKKK